MSLTIVPRQYIHGVPVPRVWRGSRVPVLGKAELMALFALRKAGVSWDICAKIWEDIYLPVLDIKRWAYPQVAVLWPQSVRKHKNKLRADEKFFNLYERIQGAFAGHSCCLQKKLETVFLGTEAVVQINVICTGDDWLDELCFKNRRLDYEMHNKTMIMNVV